MVHPSQKGQIGSTRLPNTTASSLLPLSPQDKIKLMQQLKLMPCTTPTRLLLKLTAYTSLLQQRHQTLKQTCKTKPRTLPLLIGWHGTAWQVLRGMCVCAHKKGSLIKTMLVANNLSATTCIQHLLLPSHNTAWTVLPCMLRKLKLVATPESTAHSQMGAAECQAQVMADTHKSHAYTCWQFYRSTCMLRDAAVHSRS